MTIARRAARFAAICTFLAMLAVASVCATGRAWAQPYGGISAVSPEPGPPPAAAAAPGPPPAAAAAPGPPGTAAIVRGRAIAPADAPAAVKRVIAAANRIRTKPYVWGGGHGRWWDRGYDCSGSVSYALHGGELIDSPMPSGPMASWGRPGPGHWITVYANAGHAYAVIAGLRWDTSGNTSGTGPRWHTDMASSAGFVARHPPGY
jgi:cell wall-associated NlpC family hydrolase